jgi:hypothetical protein
MMTDKLIIAYSSVWPLARRAIIGISFPPIPWPMTVASRVAIDLPHWAMRLARYCLIRMAIEMASKAATFFSVVDYLSCITVAK